jgi:acetyl-CoA synthetase
MSRPSSIRKGPIDPRHPPKLVDLAGARAAFSWDEARQRLAGLPGGGLNIAWEAVERHARSARADHTAIRWFARDGAKRDISYAALAADVSRFADALRALGIGKGDCVFLLCGRIPELYTAALGALRIGAVVSPLFAAFGRSRFGRGCSPDRRGSSSPPPRCTSARSRRLPAALPASSTF